MESHGLATHTGIAHLILFRSRCCGVAIKFYFKKENVIFNLEIKVCHRWHRVTSEAQTMMLRDGTVNELQLYICSRIFGDDRDVIILSMCVVQSLQHAVSY